MDTFFEQLVAIKKTSKTWLAYFAIALLAIAIMTVTFWIVPQIFIIVIAVVFFGIYKLYSLLNIEYEYIITNSIMDIDRIIAKSSRKRVLTFNLGEVERVEKYRADLPQEMLKDCLFACNKNDENAIVMIIHSDGKPKKSLIVAPDDRMKDAMKKFLPKYVADTLN